MIEKTKRKLLASFAVMIFLYMCIMFAQSRFMSMKSRETIGEIGELYMSEVNRQMQQKFEAVTDIWLHEGQAIIQRTPPEEAVYGRTSRVFQQQDGQSGIGGNGFSLCQKHGSVYIRKSGKEEKSVAGNIYSGRKTLYSGERKEASVIQKDEIIF